MKTAVYAGSFDPFTEGHCDIMCRAAQLFDKLYIAVLVNSNKREVFTMSERKAMIEAVIRDVGLDNTEVVASQGLLVEYAAKIGAEFIVRGIRSASELDYELTLERANKHLDSDIETVYLLASADKAHISSSMVREIASYNGKIDGLVPQTIKTMIAERLNNDE
ncbi:MAG: pantetheine-phosphate adenylyltransferase [Clostridia bacterium]|nr:pantetheine-phosphate adenylyltransferase [Clostridia bacterium]